MDLATRDELFAESGDQVLMVASMLVMGRYVGAGTSAINWDRATHKQVASGAIETAVDIVLEFQTQREAAAARLRAAKMPPDPPAPLTAAAITTDPPAGKPPEPTTDTTGAGPNPSTEPAPLTPAGAAAAGLAGGEQPGASG